MEVFSVKNVKKGYFLFSLASFSLMFSAAAGVVPLEYSPFFWAHPLCEHPDPPLFLSLFLSPCWSLFRWSDNGEVYLGNIYSTV